MKQLNEVAAESLGEARTEEIIANNEREELEAREEAALEGQKPKRGRRGRSKLVLPKHIQEIVEGTAAEAADFEFVDLVDLLPPLPEKGNFDVTTIKKSLYFFS